MPRAASRGSALKSFGARVIESIRWRVVARITSNRFVVPYLSLCARIILRIHKPTIVGVTGSVGKTTTTQMIAAVLSAPEAEPMVGRVGWTPKNLNDDTGLPLAVLQFDDFISRATYQGLGQLCRVLWRVAGLAVTRTYPKVLVLEYGTHWEGHLHRLARLARPTIGIVTTVGPAHLDRLKTLEGVVHEKSAVVSAVPANGLVILGDGHEFVSQFERVARAPVIKVNGRGIELSRNIARVVGRRFGIPDHVVASALEQFKAPAGRLSRFESAGISVIDDSYNANPMSMRLGLDTLAESAAPGQRRVAILGSMAELGDESPRYHEDVGLHARTHADFIIGVGDLAKHYAPDQWFADSDACAGAIWQLVCRGDCVLIKGSASVRMKTIAAALRGDPRAIAAQTVGA